jgi:integrase
LWAGFVDVSKVISEIRKSAGVIVNREQGKFASAHDFRRALGTRWASNLKPADLQQLMRHALINTTLGYYVRVDADSLAERLREQCDYPFHAANATENAGSAW